MSISQKQVKVLFAKSESAFETCWKTLVLLKHANTFTNESVKDLIMFQEILATPLFELQKFRNDISAHERKLIAAKKRYNTKWFAQKMNCLAVYREGIDQVINIGKNIGDAFAYFFYRSDLELLQKQYFHKRIPNITAGTGGLGELTFLRSQKHLGGNLTIFHGITHILRYGDFSFYDLKKHRITEIGELKTKKLNDKQYELMLTAVSVETTSGYKPRPRIKGGMDQRTEDKLNRQINAIAKMLAPEKVDFQSNADIKGTFYIAELQTLYDNSKLNVSLLSKVSPGLLYAGVKLAPASLFTRIFERKINKVIKDLPDLAVEGARSLLKQGSPNNSIILGQLLFNPDYTDKNTPGTPPLFWLPLSGSLLKDLYFNRFMVVSLFNPGHLIEDVVANGYKVDSKYCCKETVPVEGGLKRTIENFDFFISYIVNFLQSEQSILHAIKKVELTRPGTSQKLRISIRPQITVEPLN